jgi:hypothetical protein
MQCITMPYKKKATSTPVKTAKVRASGMKSIAPDLDLGDGMSLEAYEAAIQATEQKIAEYNTALASISELQSEVKQSEKDLAERSERMLGLVGGRYGKTSNEYEKAGGKKRVPRTRKPKAANPESSVSAIA